MRKFLLNFICYGLTLTLCQGTIPRNTKDYRKLSDRTNSEFVPTDIIPDKGMTAGGEPSCENLRAMWRFSRRQARAPLINNEIPTYRDPFLLNKWEIYPKPRSVVGTLRSNVRPWSRPVYGRIVQNAPSHHPRLQQNPAYEEVLRFLDNSKTDSETRRRMESPLSVYPAGLWVLITGFLRAVAFNI